VTHPTSRDPDGSDPDRSGGSDPDSSGASDPEQAALHDLAERETAYGLLQRGKALMSRRHFAQAAVVLERASALEPGRGSITEALARALFNSGQPGRAAAAFERLLEIDPTNPYGHYGLGRCLERSGRLEEARLHYRLAAALDPASRLYRNALERTRGPDQAAPGSRPAG
jgi:Flp pilus assembly protein TadD